MFGGLLALKTLELLFRFVIQTMPDEFDSHDFIAALAFQHPGSYIRALRVRAINEHPFLVVNKEIERRLSKSGFVREIGTRTSEDMFKRMNSVTLWQKV